tara:strand:+ start:109 stop:648 length:540 start_codon:yes stop_codon:yes gene_type:complete
MIPKKICTKCNIEKPFSDFHKDRTTKIGVRSQCKQCIAADPKRITRVKKHYQENKEEIKKKTKEWYYSNIDKVKETGRKYRNKSCNKERAYNNNLIRLYGIDINRYNQILESQNYGCAICGSKETGRKDAKNFSVDHCHATKKVRGLLCKSCNIMLGEAKDNTRILYKAIEYLGRVDNT